MSKEDAVEQSDSQINDFIDAVAQENYTQASNYMEDILGVKMQDAIDQMKIKVSSDVGIEEAYKKNDDDEDEMDDEDDDELEERNKENAMKRKNMDASRGAKFKLNNPVPDRGPEHKAGTAHNKAIGRALRNENDDS